MTYAQPSLACPSCSGPVGNGRFCLSCGLLNRYPDSGAYAASRIRRLSGAVLEGLLLTVTLGIGWLIWLAIVAPRSQTPAKQLLDMYILKGDGTPASATRVWVREIVIEGLVFGLLASFLFGVGTILDALWILWDKDRQTLHDKMADTVVVRPRLGLHPLREGALSAPEPAPPPYAPPPPPGAGPYAAHPSIEERLRDLRELADRGLITPDEYDERRRQILREL